MGTLTSVTYRSNGVTSYTGTDLGSILFGQKRYAPIITDNQVAPANATYAWVGLREDGHRSKDDKYFFKPGRVFTAENKEAARTSLFLTRRYAAIALGGSQFKLAHVWVGGQKEAYASDTWDVLSLGVEEIIDVEKACLDFAFKHLKIRFETLKALGISPYFGINSLIELIDTRMNGGIKPGAFDKIINKYDYLNDDIWWRVANHRSGLEGELQQIFQRIMRGVTYMNSSAQRTYRSQSSLISELAAFDMTVHQWRQGFVYQDMNKMSESEKEDYLKQHKSFEKYKVRAATLLKEEFEATCVGLLEKNNAGN